MPALVASITPELPPWVIKSFTFGCPEIGIDKKVETVKLNIEAI